MAPQPHAPPPALSSLPTVPSEAAVPPVLAVVCGVPPQWVVGGMVVFLLTCWAVQSRERSLAAAEAGLCAASGRLGFLTNYRAMLMITTVLAILA